MDLAKINKALAGLVAGAVVSFLMKHNIIIADNLPDSLEIVISALFTFAGVYFAPKNKS